MTSAVDTADSPVLGVDTVHWYARGAAFEAVIAAYVAATGVRDTFRRARPIAPETLGSHLLENSGVSASQVLYYADCKLRSIYRAPTEWLSYTDRALGLSQPR